MSQEIKPPVAVMDTVTMHNVGYDETNAIIDTDGKPFETDVYSRFKYGDGGAVRSYAARLAEHLIEVRGDEIGSSYVAGSASKHVPTAAHAISSALISELCLRGYTPAGAFRVDRSVVRSNDYSALSQEERDHCTTNNGLVLPEVSLSQLRGEQALVVDDIKVTGSHEVALRHVLGNVGLRAALFVYIAAVEPDVARRNPKIEHELNHSYVKSLDEVANLASGPEFILNARTCKFILLSAPDAIEAFVASIPPFRAHGMLSSMIADGYHRMPDFAQTFNVFSQATGARIQSEVLHMQPRILTAS